MATPLYFGPYNDPGDSQDLHHWDVGHDPDCHNPALTVIPGTNADQSISLSIWLAVRNNSTVVSANDVAINLYAAASGLLDEVADVNDLAVMLLNNAGITQIGQWQNQTIPAHSALQDNVWTPGGPINWNVPAYANGFILMATLQSLAGGQFPAPAYSQDPSVGLWLG